MVLQDSTVSSELTFVTTSALQCLPTVQVQLQVQVKAKAKVQVQECIWVHVQVKVMHLSPEARQVQVFLGMLKV